MIIYGKYIGICALCKDFGRIHKHHIKPDGKGKQVLMICNDCHTIVHKTFTNKELHRMTLIGFLDAMKKIIKVGR